MPKLIVLDCVGVGEGGKHRHTVYNGSRRVLTTLVSGGLITDAGALSELRRDSWEFVRKFKLEVVDEPLRILKGGRP